MLQVALANAKLVEHMSATYKPNRLSVVGQNNLGRLVDVTEKFKHRTDFYAKEAGPRRPHKKPEWTTSGPPSKSIPKTLGCAICSGCSRKSFFNADGVKLTPCQSCGQVYYCSRACAVVDYQSHKLICNYHKNRHWMPFGTRPMEDQWVDNSAMTQVRQMLRRRETLFPGEREILGAFHLLALGVGDDLHQPCHWSVALQLQWSKKYTDNCMAHGCLRSN